MRIVLCSLDMQFNKHAVVLLPGRESWGMPFTLSAEERVSHYFLMISLALTSTMMV